MGKRGKPVLLTFVGSHDPFQNGLITGQELAGPVIALARNRKFEKIFIFSTPGFEERAKETARVLQNENTLTEIKPLPIVDPIDYQEIICTLRPILSEIRNELPDASFYISVTSGTPQIHAVWILLAGSGEFPAHILNVRPPKFVSTKMLPVVEFDLSDPNIPRIKAAQGEWISDKEVGEDAEETAIRIGITWTHPVMKELLHKASRFAASSLPLIIEGETGTGKELFAQLIHQLSRRPGKFVVMNCAGISQQLFESELFGHKKGSFTGANSNRKGRFDEAENGTLFLDEIGELPQEIQAKLLRALESNEVQPVGENEPHKVDVRIIAATNNKVSDSENIENAFRKDFYFRFTHKLVLPPLRERRIDIPIIAVELLERANKSQKKQKRITPEALLMLEREDWEGNVRDLRNVIDNAVILSSSKEIGEKEIRKFILQKRIDSKVKLYDGFKLDEHLNAIREEYYELALKEAEGNRSKAARLLGVSPQAVSNYLNGKKEEESGK